MNLVPYFLPLAGLLLFACRKLQQFENDVERQLSEGDPIKDEDVFWSVKQELFQTDPSRSGDPIVPDELLMEDVNKNWKLGHTYRFFQEVYEINDFNIYMAYLANYKKILLNSGACCSQDRMLKRIQELLFYVELGKTSYQDNLPACSPWSIVDRSRWSIFDRSHSRQIAYLEFLKSKSDSEERIINPLLDDLRKRRKKLTKQRSLVDEPPADLTAFAEKYDNHDTTAFVTYVSNVAKIWGWLLSKNSSLHATEIRRWYKESLHSFSVLFPLQSLTELTNTFNRLAAIEYLLSLKEQLERGDLTNKDRQSEHRMIKETLRQVIAMTASNK